MAVHHLAERRRLDGRTAPSELIVSIAESTATRTSAMPSACARSIAFCRMSAFSSSVGAMLTAASVMIRRLLATRHVHHEAVADAPRGAQAGLAPHHGGHQLVGVQAALHQRLGLALAHQLHRRGRGRLAVRRLDDLGAGQVDAVRGGDARGCARAGRPGTARSGPSGPPPSPLQRGGIAGVRHRRRRRRQRLAGVDQALVLLALDGSHVTSRRRRVGRRLRAVIWRMPELGGGRMSVSPR